MSGWHHRVVERLSVYILIYQLPERGGITPKTNQRQNRCRWSSFKSGWINRCAKPFCHKPLFQHMVRVERLYILSFFEWVVFLYIYRWRWCLDQKLLESYWKNGHILLHLLEGQTLNPTNILIHHHPSTLSTVEKSLTDRAIAIHR